MTARGLDRFVGAEGPARLGVVCAGKTYRDVLGALEACGVGPADLAGAGIRVLKLAMTYPVAPARVLELAGAADEILVVEEKRPFVEQQVRAIVHEAGLTTPVRGKRDSAGAALVPMAGELTADRLVPVLTRVVPDLAPPPAPGLGRARLPLAEAPGRLPAFCSGCPHNRSTVVPVGSITGGGVGCHGMIHFEPRHGAETFVPPTPMGAEGTHWVGLAPFVGDRHLFQNLGDGTFSHSGSLAVRACVAAGVHITFKLLYNSHVAMTGGQDVTGLMDVPSLTRSLAAEGVSAIAVCTDDVDRYGRAANFAPGVSVRPREDVVDVQEELRRHPGVSVLIYDQRCAAEARRLRKRGELDDPPRRVVINQAVCEGCGDCSRVSNCLSVLPVETEFGERREIHQSSCNKDYSCLEGDCPSFVTLVPDERRRGRRTRTGTAPGALEAARPQLPPGDLPTPQAGPITGRFSVYTTGIGGTGIVTANRIVARAAVIAGYAVQGVDQTGLSQKAGAVVSHLHVAPAGADVTTATVADGDADLYLSGDILQAASAPHLRKVVPGRTSAVVDTAFVPTASMLQTDGSVDQVALATTLREAVGPERTLLADTTGLAEAVFGDHLPANVVLLGAAFQRGALPLPLEAIDQAIAEQGRAAATNREALVLGPLARPRRRGRGRGRRSHGIDRGAPQSAVWDPSDRLAAARPGPGRATGGARGPPGPGRAPDRPAPRLPGRRRRPPLAGPRRPRRPRPTTPTTATPSPRRSPRAGSSCSPTRTSTRSPASTCGSTSTRWPTRSASPTATGCSTTCTRRPSAASVSTTRSPSAAAWASWRSAASPRSGGSGAPRSTCSATPATGARSAPWPTSTRASSAPPPPGCRRRRMRRPSTSPGAWPRSVATRTSRVRRSSGGGPRRPVCAPRPRAGERVVQGRAVRRR